MKKRKDNGKANIKATENATKNSTVSLAAFVENPDNPSVATDEDIARLAGKLKRVPLGLTAMRIAYVTDREDGDCKGKRVVISGNKRLRVLKQAYGENGEVPAEWFADVTAIGGAIAAGQKKFIQTAGVDYEIYKRCPMLWNKHLLELFYSFLKNHCHVQKLRRIVMKTNAYEKHYGYFVLDFNEVVRYNTNEVYQNGKL